MNSRRLMLALKIDPERHHSDEAKHFDSGRMASLWAPDVCDGVIRVVLEPCHQLPVYPQDRT
jgi:hypothetical protein